MRGKSHSNAMIALTRVALASWIFGLLFGCFEADRASGDPLSPEGLFQELLIASFLESAGSGVTYISGPKSTAYGEDWQVVARSDFRSGQQEFFLLAFPGESSPAILRIQGLDVPVSQSAQEQEIVSLSGIIGDSAFSLAFVFVRYTLNCDGATCTRSNPRFYIAKGVDLSIALEITVSEITTTLPGAIASQSSPLLVDQRGLIGTETAAPARGVFTAIESGSGTVQSYFTSDDLATWNTTGTPANACLYKQTYRGGSNPQLVCASADYYDAASDSMFSSTIGGPNEGPGIVVSRPSQNRVNAIRVSGPQLGLFSAQGDFPSLTLANTGLTFPGSSGDVEDFAVLNSFEDANRAVLVYKLTADADGVFHYAISSDGGGSYGSANSFDAGETGLRLLPQSFTSDRSGIRAIYPVFGEGSFPEFRQVVLTAADSNWQTASYSFSAQ